jgi:hypothetical protein
MSAEKENVLEMHANRLEEYVYEQLRVAAEGAMAAEYALFKVFRAVPGYSVPLKMAGDLSEVLCKHLGSKRAD